MKKFLSAIIVITLLLTMMPLGVFAATDATVYVEASKETVSLGESLTYSVYIEGTYSGYALTIDTKQSGLTVTNVTSDSVYADNCGDTWVLSISPSPERNYPKTLIATVSVTVDADAAPGTKEFGFSDIIITYESSESVPYTTQLDSVTVIAELGGTLALTGVTAPVKHAAPVTVNDITAPANTTVTSLTWSPAVTSKFATNTAYTATINVKANDGYFFTEGVAFTVDGASWTAAKQSDGSYNLTKTFPKTADKDTPTCNAPTGLTAIYGQKLSNITLNNPAGNTAGTWTWVAPNTSVGDVGTRTFKATFTPDNTDEYVTVENIDVTVTVNPKQINITVDDIADQEYTGSQIKPTVVVKGDGKVLVLGTDYTVEYGTNKNVAANGGSVTVKPKTGGNYTFSNATENFNIVAKAGTITISGNLNVTFGTAIPDVTVNKNGSTGAVTVYYYTNAACTEGRTATKPTKVGDYWAKAEMAADANFGSAVSNALAFTISPEKINFVVAIIGVTAPVKKATPITKDDITAPANTTVTSLTWSPAVNGKFEANTAYTATINIKANDGYVFANGVKLKVDGATDWAEEKQADGSYNLTKTFPKTADKDAPTCTAPTGLTVTYGQTLADLELVNPTGNTAGTWTWAVPTTSVGKVGTKTFKATFTPDNTDEYATVENIDVTVKVDPKQITVTVENIADQEYTGSQIKPTVVVKGDGKTLVLGTDYTVEYGANKNVAANGGSVTVKSKTGSNYIFSTTTKNFNIVAKAGKITISGNLGVTYGTAISDVTVDKHGSTGAVTVYYYTNEACTTGKTATKPTNAGSYWARAEMTADANFGSAVSNALAFTIARANITPAVTINGWTYGTDASAPAVVGNTGNGTVTYQYKVKGAADSTYSVAVPTNAGDYTVKATVAQTANYNSGSATADFKISPKNISGVTIGDIADQTYTGSAITPKPTVNDGTKGLVSGTDFTYEYENNTNVGTAATVKVVGKGNYTGTATKAFTIVRANLTLTVNITGWTVNAAPNAPTVSGNLGNGAVTYEYKVKGAEDSTYTATVPTEAGDYTVKATLAQTDNYNAATATADFVISLKSAQTITAENLTVVYGDSDKAVAATTDGNGTLSYAVKSGSEFVDIDSATGALTIKKAGTATITVTASETDTHAPAAKDITVTVNPKQIAIPAADGTVYTYNGREQTYRIFANDAYTVTGNKQTKANETGYTITVALKDNVNYQWNDGSNEALNYTFVILKATITITAHDKTISLNSEVPTLGSYDYTVSGLVNGEKLKTDPIIKYQTTPDISVIGNTSIDVFGAQAPEGGNYNEIVYMNGLLAIVEEDAVPNEYTVKFDTNGGSKVNDVTVTENSVVAKPAAPTKEGFEFNGWYADKEFKTAYDFTSKVTADITLYAKWTEIKQDPVVTEWENPFGDVKETNWYYEYVKYAAENKLMQGVSTNTFAPSDNITRAMFVTILYRIDGEPDAGECKFTDVKAGAWYEKAVAWASANGITSGVTETTFAPNDNITREQMVTMLFRYAKLKGAATEDSANDLIAKFADVNSISGFATAAMNWAVEAEIIVGNDDNTVAPKTFATRAQAAAMFMRFIEKIK